MATAGTDDCMNGPGSENRATGPRQLAAAVTVRAWQMSTPIAVTVLVGVKRTTLFVVKVITVLVVSVMTVLVLNVVTTTNSSAVGKTLCEDGRVRKLSFTGSTPIGKVLYEQCAGTMKKLSLELGGNAPFIVFDDADLEAAVDGAIASKYRNTGQTCVCANRLIVQSGIHDAFAARLAEKVAALKVGPGTGDGVQIGPLINDKALCKVDRLVTEAVRDGARVLTGGDLHGLGGLFYMPTVLVDATPQMALFQEEIFGPVAPIVKFETEAEAIDLANATPFGLASYFYSRDVGRCWRVAEAIEAGMVGINEGLISTEVAPFGGVKESGLGREGSSEGLDEYLETKYLCFGGVG